MIGFSLDSEVNHFLADSGFSIEAGCFSTNGAFDLNREANIKCLAPTGVLGLEPCQGSRILEGSFPCSEYLFRFQTVLKSGGGLSTRVDLHPQWGVLGLDVQPFLGSERSMVSLVPMKGMVFR